MMEFRFDDKASFLEKLEELLESGVSPRKMTVIMPHPDHDVEHLIEHYDKPSKLKYFTLAGGLTGCITGYAFTNWTALDWPLITGSKPLMSWAPYTVIAFELTILFGALVSFAGLLLLGRLPRFSRIVTEEVEDYGNQFVIMIEDEG